MSPAVSKTYYFASAVVSFNAGDIVTSQQIAQKAEVTCAAAFYRCQQTNSYIEKGYLHWYNRVCSVLDQPIHIVNEYIRYHFPGSCIQLQRSLVSDEWQVINRTAEETSVLPDPVPVQTRRYRWTLGGKPVIPRLHYRTARWCLDGKLFHPRPAYRTALDAISNRLPHIKQTVFCIDGQKLATHCKEFVPQTILNYTHTALCQYQKPTTPTYQILQKQHLLCVVEAHTDTISAMAVSADNHWLFTGDAFGTVKQWSFHTGLIQHTWVIATSYISSIAVSEDNMWMVVCAIHDPSVGTTNVYNLQTQAGIATLHNTYQAYRHATIHNSSLYLVDSEGTLVRYNLPITSYSQPVEYIGLQYSRAVFQHHTYNWKHKLVSISTLNSGVYLVHTHNKGIQQHITPHASYTAIHQSIFSPDNTYLAITCTYHNSLGVEVWSRDENNSRYVMFGVYTIPPQVQAAQFRYGIRCAWGSDSKTLVAATYQQLHVLYVDSAYIRTNSLHNSITQRKKRFRRSSSLDSDDETATTPVFTNTRVWNINTGYISYIHRHSIAPDVFIVCISDTKHVWICAWQVYTNNVLWARETHNDQNEIIMLHMSSGTFVMSNMCRFQIYGTADIGPYLQATITQDCNSIPAGQSLNSTTMLVRDQKYAQYQYQLRLQAQQLIQQYASQHTLQNSATCATIVECSTHSDSDGDGSSSSSNEGEEYESNDESDLLFSWQPNNNVIHPTELDAYEPDFVEQYDAARQYFESAQNVAT